MVRTTLVAIVAFLSGGIGEYYVHPTIRADSTRAYAARSVGFFLRHEEARRSVLDGCNNNPGLDNPECTHARIAGGELYRVHILAQSDVDAKERLQKLLAEFPEN